MAATATAPMTQPTVFYPSVTNETLERMRQEQHELLRTPERMEPPAELNRTEKYIFRSQPHTVRRIMHELDVKPEAEPGDDSVTGRQKRFLKTRWEMRHKADSDGDEKRLAYIAEQIGGPVLAFNALHAGRNRWECWFATNDPIVATYVRDLVTRAVGEFAYVYEQDGTARLVVGEMAFPNTEMGWKAAREHAQLAGVGDIKIVSGG